MSSLVKMEEVQSQETVQNTPETPVETQENQQIKYVAVVREPTQIEFFKRQLKDFKGIIHYLSLEAYAIEEFGFNAYNPVTEEQAAKYRNRPDVFELIPVRGKGMIYQEDVKLREETQEQNTQENQEQTEQGETQ